MCTCRVCPPRPEQLIYAITLLQQKIMIERGTVKKALNLVPVDEYPSHCFILVASCRSGGVI